MYGHVWAVLGSVMYEVLLHYNNMFIVTFIVNALLVCDQVMHGKRDFNIYAMHDVC